MARPQVRRPERQHHFWNVHRSSAPGLGANESVPCGKWCKPTAFRHCARSSKRAGGLIPRIALDQCRVPERYRTRAPVSVLVAQIIERARPNRQVAGVNPAEDTIIHALKAFSAMHSLGNRISPVQFRVRAPFSQSSQRSGRFHKPAVSRAALEIATICLHAAACGLLL